MRTLLSILLIALSLSVAGQKPDLLFWLDNDGADSSEYEVATTLTNAANFSTTTVKQGTHSWLPNTSNGRIVTDAAYNLGTVWTASFWLRSGVGADTKVLMSNITGGGVNGFYLQVNFTDNSFKVSTWDASLNDAYASSTTNAFTDGQWFNLIVSVNGATCTFYVDGVDVTSDGTIQDDYNSNAVLSFGANTNGTGALWGFANVDNVQVYKRTLIQSGIDSLVTYGDSKVTLGMATGEPGTYSPVAGRHVRFKKGGIELKDKPDPSGFYYWNIKGIPSPIFYTTYRGIYDVIGTEDYDGVCPTGVSRVDDADCIINDLDLAPLRKIRSVSDYTTVKYIDPSAGDGGNGTEILPYNSWWDVTVVDNMAILFKRGTTYNITETITNSSNNLLVGAYGTGEAPKIVMYGKTQRVFYLTGSGLRTFRDVYISNPYPNFQSPRPLPPQGSAAGIDISDNVEIDIYNCEFQYGWMGVRSAGFQSKIRIINCIGHDLMLEAFWPRGNYIEVRFCKIYDNNAYWYDEPRKDTQAGKNTGSTGDGIEFPTEYDNPLKQWKQLYLANTLIDKGKTGNKATIQYHNEVPNHEMDITENCILIGPYNGIYDDERLCNTNSHNSLFINNYCLASPNSATPTNGMYIYPNTGTTPISIIGSVFMGFDKAIENGRGTIANSTFNGNTYAVYTSGASTIAKWNNNITYDNTTIFSAGTTVTSSENNVTSDPSFDPTDTLGFKITVSSSARDAGNSTIYRDYDILGTHVVLPQDAGAHEYAERDTANILFIGNSTMYPIYDLFVADDEPYHCTNIAESGDNIQGQLTKWNALTTVQKQGFDYVLVQVGINNLYAAEPIVTLYQSLIDQINTDNPNCKIIAATLSPCRGGPYNYAVWLTINEAIRGEGATPITGVDVVMTTNTTDLDVNSDGYLDDAYKDADYVHPNDAGDLIMKNNYLEVLEAQ